MEGDRTRHDPPHREALTMARLSFWPMSRRMRRARLRVLIGRLERLEQETRDVCAAVMELTEPDDDLHVAVRLLVEALDG